MISLYEPLLIKYQQVEESFEEEVILPKVSKYFDQLKSFFILQISNYLKFSLGFSQFKRTFENIKDSLGKLKEMQVENTQMRLKKSIKLFQNYVHYKQFFNENKSKFESERVAESKEELGNTIIQDFPSKQITEIFTSSLKSTLKQIHKSKATESKTTKRKEKSQSLNLETIGYNNNENLQFYRIKQYQRTILNPLNIKVILLFINVKYKIQN